MPIEPGDYLGRYKILYPLGSGGMGAVFLAQDLQLGRHVALKVLSDKLAVDQNQLHRFEQEAQAASALNHPNILTIYETGAEGPTHFIATELVDGQTLRQRLTGARIGLSEALDISVQVAAAMAAAHAVGIAHRDLKPENVMLRADGYVKVLDFGLAKLAEKPVDSSKPDP